MEERSLACLLALALADKTICPVAAPLLMSEHTSSEFQRRPKTNRSPGIHQEASASLGALWTEQLLYS